MRSASCDAADSRKPGERATGRSKERITDSALPASVCARDEGKNSRPSTALGAGQSPNGHFNASEAREPVLVDILQRGGRLTLSDGLGLAPPLNCSKVAMAFEPFTSFWVIETSK